MTPSNAPDRPQTDSPLRELAPWQRRARAATLALSALLALGVLPLYARKVALKTDYTDFEVYYRAAARMKQGLWSQVYNLGDGASPFRYAPPLLPWLRGLAELELPQAKLLWYFLQFGWFALGFFFLHRAIRMTRVGRGRRGIPGQALWITAASVLFILRFCLDSFTIGQVSSLLFLGYCAGLCTWMARRPGWAGASLLVPSVFKIGPGFLYGLFASSRKPGERVRALGAPLLALAASTALLRAWVGSSERFGLLWRGWVEVVANDSVYYDASHYGSQSIKSAILRAVKWGWLSPGTGHALYLGSAIAGCLLILGFWGLRRARGPLGRGLFYALGIFPYVWFMPETFKYSLTTLAIPAALLLACPRKGRLEWGALAVGALTLSLAGLDIVGKTLFFGMQNASVPLAATLLLAAAVAKQALRHSRPALGSEPQGRLGPWPELPSGTPTLGISVLVPLPLQSHSSLPASWTRQVLEDAESAFAAFTRMSGPGSAGAGNIGGFEILVVPFGDRVSELHPSWQAALEAARAPGSRIRLLAAAASPGRGGALRAAFLASKGRWLASVPIEQPCAMDFYARALGHVASNAARIVHGNRRHPESRFRIPVKHLPLVYGRHRLGLAFNRLVRAVLPVRTTDTHSGSWVMDREAATAVFARQRFAGFLFELEVGLTAAAHGFAEADLPVSLILAQEKTPRRIGLEAWSILRGLPELSRRYRQGCYHPQPAPQAITSDDWGITPGVNHGILELARAGIVRRVSLMAHSGYLREGLDELKALPGMSLGLHFDLTYAKTTPGKVLLRGLRGGAQRRALEQEASTEIRRQLGILKDAGVAIAHLDGHHHIHLMPGVLEAIAPALREHGIRRVRLPYDRGLILAKPGLAALAWLSRARVRRLGFEPLECFYPQLDHFLDPGLFRARLGSAPEAEVIVHPAERDDLAALGIPDPYTSGRVLEYRALRMLGVK